MNREDRVIARAAIEAIEYYKEFVKDRKKLNYFDADDYAEDVGIGTFCCDYLVRMIEINASIPPAVIIETEINRADEARTQTRMHEKYRYRFGLIKATMEDIYDYAIINSCEP